MKKIAILVMELIMLMTSINIVSVHAAVVDYDVYQKSGVYAQAGVGGFSILADFAEGVAPGEIYFARTTVVPGGREADLPFTPSSVAMVINPAGEVVVAYDFSDIPTGTVSHKINITEAMDGVWQFKFTSGRTGDELEIGLDNARNWGIRGETILGVTSTTPKTSYIYVPDTVKDIYIGSTSTSSYPTLKSEGTGAFGSDETVLSTSNHMEVFMKRSGRISGTLDEGVYKLSLPSNKTGYGIMVDIAPSLMCKTKAMAEALMGGWQKVENVWVQGSIQAAARRELLRVAREEDLTYTFTKPVYDYRNVNYYNNLKNPLLEQYLIRGGNSPISNLAEFVSAQETDPNSKYCGMIVSKKDSNHSWVNETIAGWEDGLFPSGYEFVSTAYGQIINMEGAELNAFVGHKGLINRTLLSILASLSQLSEDVMIKDSIENTSNPYSESAGSYPYTHGEFYYSWLTNPYYGVREHIEGTDTCRIIDDAMKVLTYKMSNIRGFQTNQWFFTVEGIASCYLATGDEIMKNMLDKHIEGILVGPHLNKGQSSLGYFLENGGADGDYFDMGRGMFYSIYEKLLHNDSGYRYLPQMKTVIDKTLEFDSLFRLTENNKVGNAYADMPGTNAASSRKTVEFAPRKTGHTTFEYLIDEFPLAKRRWEINYAKDDTPSLSLAKYFDVYDTFGSNQASGDENVFNALKGVMEAESAPLPVEQEYGIWDKDGLIAVKHNGLYMNIFYAFPEIEEKLPDMSFLGGGISLLWGEGVEGVSASRKPNNYSRYIADAAADEISARDYSDILSSCVFGKKSDGTIFATGKEIADLTWIEENKKFSIRGTTPDDIDVTYTYSLEDYGINMNIRATGDTSEKWINIPITDANTNGIVKYKPDEGTLSYILDGKGVTFKWDPGLSSTYIEDVTDHDFNGNQEAVMNCLRINMSNTEAVDVRIMHSTTVKPEIINSEFRKLSGGSPDLVGIKLTVENLTCEKKPYTCITAVYDDIGSFIDCIISNGNVETEVIEIDQGFSLPENAQCIKVFLWERLSTMKPYDGMIEVPITAIKAEGEF